MAIKITQIEGHDDEGCANLNFVLERDGNQKIKFFARCLSSDAPEDAMLERDLSYAYDVLEAFKIGYEAGKSSETIEIIEKEETNE